jgi:hypothetical protein
MSYYGRHGLFINGQSIFCGTSIRIIGRLLHFGSSREHEIFDKNLYLTQIWLFREMACV